MTIRHSQGSYEVLCLPLRQIAAHLPRDSRIISDENTWRLFGDLFSGIPAHPVKAGESSKCLQTFSDCLSWLARSGASRKTSVVALGGGVVGDLTGFVASAYMRGVPFIQIPTTLLAQVDSSVGGKVGVDLPEGKNMAGAFYPPSAVYVATDALESLPKRQFLSGLAEVIKYGFIMDAGLLSQLDDAPNLSDSSFLAEIVTSCIRLKAEVVEEDEREVSGRRAILNFGHTVGHAIEKITGYDPILHGEAISVGMVAEAILGERIGMTEPGTARNVSDTLSRHGLPTADSNLRRVDEMIEAMRSDKKATEGRLAFSLLTTVGTCKLVQDVQDADVRAVLMDL
ncbi:MAG TPA: 3-dehydroquinate synthase [Fimbriimonas sp.]|nr:3-dehydroquinate synthase [Fimbriimonas sp.]